MKFNYFSLGRHIKMARKKRGITQALLSEKIDVSPSYVSYIEDGTKSMSLETFVMIANELNVSADELLCDNLENTVRVSNHQFAAELSDCSEYELRVLFDVLQATKRSLRVHRGMIKR